MYDSHCLELAERFQDEKPPLSTEELEALAQAIQDAIDNWFVGREARP